MQGTVLTETVIHAAPEHLVSIAPYQIAIVELASICPMDSPPVR